MWCKENRSKKKLLELWKIFCSKLRGHVQYYGVSLNTDGVHCFIQQATKIFFKWMNRRSQKKSFNWEQFSKFLESFPAPKAKICHRLFWNSMRKSERICCANQRVQPGVMPDRQPLALIGHDGLEMGAGSERSAGLPDKNHRDKILTKFKRRFIFRTFFSLQGSYVHSFKNKPQTKDFYGVFSS